ncbi:pyruvate dehydrogenase complex dihydrolipoamide acetyltransferase [Mesorhizobium sp. M0830]|uniref:pyruvate dehydrogenase complex dihydrolipoamide acetyltransferase n=1 Tax=Mesorhizobium sp. M0830 TaxID=2957008 RepID=UPI0033382AB5
MALNITLPALSAGMEDAVIIRWLKVEGDMVSKGEVIAEVETDKATMELGAEAHGKLERVLVSAGGRAQVGQIIAVLLSGGENRGDFALPPDNEPASAPLARVEAALPQSIGPVRAKAEFSSANQVRHKASPLARRLAAQSGSVLHGVEGSGPKGRIVRIDVERLANDVALRQPIIENAEDGGSTSSLNDLNSVPRGIGPYELVPHSSMRRTIARRLVEAKTTIPHFYLNVECNIDALLSLRGRINEPREPARRISVNDFVVKASATALRLVPDANAIWTERAILKLLDVDVAVAVATEGGLITPVVRQADKKSLGAVSSEIKALANRARESRPKPDEYQGGGFAVSNLGMYGVSSFSAIVNPPQSAILAVGAGERRPIERDGELAFATMMSCTLSIDHRCIDGALGAELLAAFKTAIENPMSILV